MSKPNEPNGGCANCEDEANRLINHLLGDIQLLALEVVMLRYAISWVLPKHDGGTLRSEILSDLYGSYYDYPAYQRFMSAYYGGNDPMEDKAFNDHLIRLSKGEVGTVLKRIMP